MQSTTKAIVLRNIKYGDQSLIVDMLTEQFGRVSFMIRIPKTKKGKLKKQFFQPLTLIEITFDYRQNIRLQRLSDVRLAIPFVSIPFHPVKLPVSLFLAEFLCHATRDEQSNPALFGFVEKSIEWYDGVEKQFANFHLVFMMRLTRFIGFFPNLDDYNKGDYFDLRSSSFSSSAPIHTDSLCPEDAERVITLMRLTYLSMHLYKMLHTDRNRITDIILRYYRLHVPSFPDLRSPDILKALFE